MERLPDDVLLLVLNKLATQHLPSLLVTTSADKLLASLVAVNPSVWEEAFFGPRLCQDGKAFFYGKQRAQLDARLKALGFLDHLQSYKELVQGRWKRETYLMEDDCLRQQAVIVPPWQTEEDDVGTFLILVRLKGSILFWAFEQAGAGESLITPRDRRPFLDSSQMHSLYPATKVSRAIRKAW